MNVDRHIEDLLRRLTPQALGVLTRRFGAFDACEDAVQEALRAAANQWPRDGVPDNPRAWLVTVATRRLHDEIRSDVARRRREQVVTDADAALAPAGVSERDDSLLLLLLCCHPALSEAAQVPLTLRSVGGLSTAQIAAAFMVPETTMAQRIIRAKQRLKQAGATFAMPTPPEWPDRLDAVLHILYLIFNEGYAATSGPDLTVRELTTEAIRLTRHLHAVLPEHGEVRGLLALLLLTEARRPARVSATGDVIPLDEQDRSRWDATMIQEGVALVTGALRNSRLGPYQLQAAIAAVHDEAASTQETDWSQILGLYALLEDLAPNPVVSLNRAIALAMTHGPSAGLHLLDTLARDERLSRGHRLLAVRGHLLQRAGELSAARDAYLAAARRSTSTPEKRYLEQKAAALN